MKVITFQGQVDRNASAVIVVVVGEYIQEGGANECHQSSLHGTEF